MKTLKELNMVLDLLNSLTDLLEEPRIPIWYAFNHKVNVWEIHNIYPKDKARLEKRLEYVYFVDLADYEWEV